MVSVSLVIPVYNEEEYIKGCIESAMDQEVAADEIIIVDNNCSDATVEIASQFPVRIVQEKTQGMIPARNRGFDEATSDIIARCDADCVLPPDWIAYIKDVFSAVYSPDAMSGPIIYYDVPLNTKALTTAYLLFPKLLQGGGETLLGPNMVLTKAIWNQAKQHVCLDDRKVHEDLDLALSIHKVGGRIRRDRDFCIYTSGRRAMKNPGSFFVEYPVRFVKTFAHHRLVRGNKMPVESLRFLRKLHAQAQFTTGKLHHGALQSARKLADAAKGVGEKAKTTSTKVRTRARVTSAKVRTKAKTTAKKIVKTVPVNQKKKS